MQKIRCTFWSLTLLAAAGAQADAQLTPMEVKWLEAAEPVLAFAADMGLVVDVIVQPTSTDSDPPLAMGARDNRCKLILSLRDRADAEETLANEPAERHALLIEAMVAHEMAHCWRFSQGMWHRWPAGFAESTASRDAVNSLEAMRATQREEAFADLAALAWIRQTHPSEYGQIFTWLEHVRADQPVPGSFHDTRLWLGFAQDAEVFASDKPLFEKAHDVWAQGF
jgi:hypothetical protein